MVRKIRPRVTEKMLQPDLEKYRRRALELGASDAQIITVDQILIDERVRAKCIYPKCGSYGTNANCPPHAMDLDQMRKIVAGYRYAIFLKVEVPGAEMTSADRKVRAPSQLKNFDIVSGVESAAFYDGHHLALGFAGGPCKLIFCPEVECAALAGKGCRHELRARSSMEAVGMNAFTMAARVGWDIYPIGRSLKPGDVPLGNRLGLVLID